MISFRITVIVALATLLATGSRALAQTDSVTRKAAVNNSGNKGKEGFQYDPDAGFQYKKGDFKITTWGYGERLFGGGKGPSWRRVRQGMEFLLPSYPFTINGDKYRTAFVYEVDFTDNNFFQPGKGYYIWENLFLSFQDSKDPNKFRVLFGENTHILSREDNLSSGNLPTVNRSMILEQHGSTRNFGIQWGLQAHSQINPKTFLQFALQDDRGSINQQNPSFRFWNGAAAKVTRSVILPTNSSKQKLNIAVAADVTGHVKDRPFTLISAINQVALGGLAAGGTKTSFYQSADYTNTVNHHFYSAEYELIYSDYSSPQLKVYGGYVLGQFQLFDQKKTGADLVPFLRYDLVSLHNPLSSANEQVIRTGLNYNLPYTHKLVNFHLEYARHWLTGRPSSVLTVTDHNFNELRFEIRISVTRYMRF